ncbi:hypothetical protein OUY22_36415, partial [Nonomuraea sp. MCN248]
IAGGADRHRLYRGGRVVAAITGEWLARPAMGAELREIRAGHAMPVVPVTVIRTRWIRARSEAGCPERTAAELDARLVHLPAHGSGPGPRLPPHALRAIADAV